MKIDFTKLNNGLVPAVIQDSATSKVLMVGFMNKEAVEKTEKEKKVTFFSRTKNRLWTKGEESGNFLLVDSMLIDCDNDTLLIKAKPTGPVCHTGADTCFNETLRQAQGDTNMHFIYELEQIILNRKNNPSEKSYTSDLFKKGINKIAQKVGEEATELVIEAKDNNADLFKNEAADLLFHYMILLVEKGFTLNDIENILKERNKK